ncbi:hypothetical protein BDP27DRAFT_1428169 [Rhodocollybia butyracea]|uniref:Uncharacterized protein n=1 Tax=Rhodocollybia butyracea TaxID=206335 RepID=A0A9P5U223_9AGAR|nr:hypothetical protein BDP27DRAFT_1428169 [Rhodocollybia butyracea]
MGDMNGWPGQLSLLVGDTIVVWRAWSLWEHHTAIQWTLVVLGICNGVLNIAACLYTAFEIAKLLPVASSESTLRVIGENFYLIFSLALNIVVIMLIAYKTWIHSNVTKALCKNEHSNKRSPFFNVLVFLVESGATFCILQAGYCTITLLDIISSVKFGAAPPSESLVTASIVVSDIAVMVLGFIQHQ